MVVDPQALADIDARLQMIYELARKHRVQPEQLVEHAKTLEAELAAMTSDSSDLDELLAAQETAPRVSARGTEAVQGPTQAQQAILPSRGEIHARIGYRPWRSEFGVSRT